MVANELRITFKEMTDTFVTILLQNGFSPSKASLCADLFAKSSLDGVPSHGLNRFPEFIRLVKEGYVIPTAEPTQEFALPVFERWNGNLGPGMLNASFAMQKAINMAKLNGIGCVSLNNTNHWMRAGNYGWQAVEAGCVGICFTNTLPNMPAWGGKEPKLGNNPLVLAVPSGDQGVVLDMAMSQFSYGKMGTYLRKGEDLPFDAGFDGEGQLTKKPADILAGNLALPFGMWKGSGLSLMLNMISSLISGGKATHEIGREKEEHAISQFFLCLDPEKLGLETKLFKERADEILQDLTDSKVFQGKEVHFPGQQSLKNRRVNLANGIPVEKAIWESVLRMVKENS
ncbi:3-dehydro-L-gulonate 2-dehydrogenase [Lunatibacter salilacus]|uniref:3-dehydro-L-gulonate 2-dehydrogenase n=1 Tax=Lunatibacter salilacus TaxID=2483804 RepID=UPI00131BF3D1|nr:3-dehydro-L-gulonate 2-dehydrogenase [Lunatibacter salilacus]